MNFPGALTILFIYLRLTHQIDWAWYWVLSPIVIAFIIGVVWGFINKATTEKKEGRVPWKAN